jgi:hypothetical protein
VRDIRGLTFPNATLCNAIDSMNHMQHKVVFVILDMQLDVGQRSAMLVRKPKNSVNFCIVSMLNIMPMITFSSIENLYSN